MTGMKLKFTVSCLLMHACMCARARARLCEKSCYHEINLLKDFN